MTKIFSLTVGQLRKAQQAILGNQKDAAMNENYIIEYINSTFSPKPETEQPPPADIEQEWNEAYIKEQAGRVAGYCEHVFIETANHVMDIAAAANRIPYCTAKGKRGRV